MRLTAIDIQALPGIDPIRLDHFSAGVNFIVGPNGIGKSSLIRGLHHILAGRRPGDPSALTISARFEDGDDVWVGARNGPAVSWQRNGMPAEPPPLPAAEVLHCYWLRAETLIAEDQASEAELSRRLREALAGGIDLEAVRATAGLTPEPFPMALRREWLEAQTTQADIERGYANLEEQRATLPELEKALQQAREARDEIVLLRQGRELREAMAKRAALAEQLASFDAVHAEMTGDEPERAEALSREISALEGEAGHLAQQQRQLGESLDATGFADGMPDGPLLQSLQRQLETLRALEKDRERAASAVASANAELDTVAKSLGAAPETHPGFTPAQVEVIGDALQALQEARAWQANTGASRQAQPSTNRWLLIAAATGGAIAAVSGLFSSNPVTIAAGTVALIASLGLWLLPRLQSGDNATTSTTNAVVREREAKLKALINEYGLEEQAFQGLGLLRFMERLRALDAARARVATASAEEATIAKKCSDLQDSLQHQLTRWAEIPRNDAISLQAAFDDVSERVQKAQEIKHEQSTLTREQEKLAANGEQKRREREQLFAQFGLAVDDMAALRRLEEQHARYIATRQALDDALVREQTLKSPFSDHPEQLQWIEQATAAEIDAVIDAREEKAGAIDELTDQIATLKAALAKAGDDNALATAMAQTQSLAGQLTDRRERRLQSALGDWLLSNVEREYRERHEPALIRDARARFEAFTHAKWSLEINDAHEPVARDLQRNEQKPLTALSSGTRMQLLLAARIAWARDQEQGQSPLPLVLDEALTNTDATRFNAIVGNLEALAAEEDRQIFYLTAREEDRALWQQAAGHAPHCIALGGERRRQDAADLPTPDSEPEIPSPKDEDASDYAKRLQVPAIDLQQPPEAIHLFHLLRDALPTLYILLNDWRVERLGPLQAWLQSPAAEHADLGAISPGELADRARLTTAWYRLARQGLGMPVDYGALASADILSDTMLPRVAEQAEEKKGDAEALIAALRDGAVKRLGSQFIDELEHWLIEAGYIDARRRLSAEEIQQTLLGELGHQIDPAVIRAMTRALNAATLKLAA